MTKRIASFEPLIDSQTRILILGSMPGNESLRKQEYYGNKANHFWPMISSLLQIDPNINYEKKLGFLLAHRVGLWDVLASCSREGSLDSNIKQGVVHDFDQLFRSYPKIECVLFNGAKAYDIFRKKVGFSKYVQINFKKMPSTSPANTLKYEKKLEEWNDLKEYVIIASNGVNG